METRHFIVGSAGHIDHGKSTLVEALTGTNPDRLPEEQKRGMTIDLGFAHLPLVHEGVEYSLGLIDVPGHADFVKNMVAGVGAIDLAMLVVACDDGWMPQTEEHVQILDYLDVPAGIVALTKSDLIDDPAAKMEEVAAELKGTFLEGAPIIPVSALGDLGMTELKLAMLKLLAAQQAPADLGKPRLAVDRVFSPKGIGTVVTGTLTGGTLKAGTEVVVEPSGHKATVRSIQSHLQKSDLAYPGMRTALNLTDLAAGRSTGEKGVGRGDTVLGESVGASDTFDVLLRKHDRVVAGQPKSLQELKDGRKVRVHLGSAGLDAQVFLVDGGKLERGRESIAQIRFAKPAFALAGDRFVLRDWGQHGTVAGGIVLDPRARRRHFHTDARKESNVTVAASLDEPAEYLAAVVQNRLAAPAEEVFRLSPFSPEQLKTAAEQSEDVLTADGWLMDAAFWNGKAASSRKIVETFHETQPDETGMPIADLRTELAMPSQEVFDLLLAYLEKEEGFTRSKGRFTAPGHKLELPAHLVAAGDRIRRQLDSANPLEPPAPSEMIVSEDDQQALRFLVETGEVIQLDPKAILSAAAYEVAREKVVAHLTAEKKATASELRQILGTTRRVLIPLLERLDSSGVTQRIEEFRVLRRKSS